MSVSPHASNPPGAIRVSTTLGLIGLAAFGGPAAHVALMRRELVERRRWVEAGEFSRMFAACNLVPGPSSTELAILLGYRLAGWHGLVLGGAFFIAPAMAIMLGLAVVYERFSATRQLQSVLYGVRPVVVAIIAWAALDLARRLLEDKRFLLLVPVAIALYALGLNPVFILALVGLVGAVLLRWRGAGASLLGFVGPDHPERLPVLFLTFLKIGAVSFGSGYVLFAFLDADFVRGLGWLQPSQLVDAVAIGQITPGPVFTTATFLGYLFAGIPGAMLATLAIFLPAFALVPLLDRVVRLVDQHRVLRLFLDAVNAAVIGLIIVVGFEIARTSLVDWLTVLLALLAFPLVLWRPLAAPIAVLAGALAGLSTVLIR